MDAEKAKGWLADKEATIGDDLRLVMAGMQHIDARISALQTTCIYIAVVLTVMLGVLVFR